MKGIKTANGKGWTINEERKRAHEDIRGSTTAIDR